MIETCHSSQLSHKIACCVDMSTSLSNSGLVYLLFIKILLVLSQLGKWGWAVTSWCLYDQAGKHMDREAAMAAFVHTFTCGGQAPK